MSGRAGPEGGNRARADPAEARGAANRNPGRAPVPLARLAAASSPKSAQPHAFCIFSSFPFVLVTVEGFLQALVFFMGRRRARLYVIPAAPHVVFV